MVGWEDPLEEGMATHSSILVWEIPWKQRAWLATVHAVPDSDTTEATYQAHTKTPLTERVNINIKIVFRREKGKHHLHFKTF